MRIPSFFPFHKDVYYFLLMHIYELVYGCLTKIWIPCPLLYEID